MLKAKQVRECDLSVSDSWLFLSFFFGFACTKFHSGHLPFVVDMH